MFFLLEMFPTETITMINTYDVACISGTLRKLRVTTGVLSEFL